MLIYRLKLRMPNFNILNNVVCEQVHKTNKQRIHKKGYILIVYNIGNSKN